jgi:hypothetical protein
MKLLEWMTKTDTDILEAAEIFGVSPHAIKKWLRGERLPRDEMKRKIRKISKGMITADDWIDGAH